MTFKATMYLFVHYATFRNTLGPGFIKVNNNKH